MNVEARSRREESEKIWTAARTMLPEVEGEQWDAGQGKRKEEGLKGFDTLDAGQRDDDGRREKEEEEEVKVVVVVVIGQRETMSRRGELNCSCAYPGHFGVVCLFLWL